MTELQYDSEFIAERIFDGEIKWDRSGTTAYFGERDTDTGKAISINELIAWMSRGDICPIESQHHAPEHWELAVYGQQLSAAYDTINMLYGGYIVSQERNDTRITIDTVYVMSSSGDEFIQEIDEDIKILFPKGDEYQTIDGGIRVWWD
jgi:hypothetical protein